MGHTQYIDAFQRAEFYNLLKNPDNYQVLLSPIKTLAPVVITVPAASGTTLPPEFGACGPFGIVDIDFFDAFLDNNVLPALQPQVNAGNFPIFMLYNTVLGLQPDYRHLCELLRSGLSRNYGDESDPGLFTFRLRHDRRFWTDAGRREYSVA